MNVPITVQGTVSKVLHASDRGGAIFVVRLRDEERAIRVLADYSVMPYMPGLGELWEVKGSFVFGVYGRQFAAVEAVLMRPEGQEIVPLLAENDAFSGVGWQLARRLWRRLGATLNTTLDASDVEMLVRHAVPAGLAISICSAWRKYCERARLHRLFSEHRISAAHLPNAFGFWANQTEAKLRDNPYRLSPLVGWAECDRIAQQGFGISKEAPQRLIAACDAVLNESLKRHSTATSYSSCIARLCEKLNSRVLAKRALALAVGQDRAVELWDGNRSYVINKGVYRIEQAIKKYFKCAPHVHPSSRIATSPTTCTGDIVSAVENAIRHPRSLVLLPSSSTNVLFSHLLTTKPGMLHISLRAMRGARDAAEPPSLRVKLASVLASPTKLNEVEAASLVFVHDSASLDTLTLGKLINRLPQSAHVCLVGDGAILPPLGIGSPFRDLCELREVPQTLVYVPLEEKAGSIPAAAHSILDGRLPDQVSKGLSPHQFDFISVENSNDGFEKAIELYRVAIDTEDVVIFTATQRSANALNVRLHCESVELRAAMGLSTPFLYLRNNLRVTEGDKIVSLSTDYSSGLLRGDRGVIAEVLNAPLAKRTESGRIESVVAVANFESFGRLEITKARLQELSLGYAIPLSRSLPSNFDTVIILSQDRRVVDRTWYYTAVGQGKRRVWLIGNREQVAAVIANPANPRVRPSSISLEAASTSRLSSTRARVASRGANE